MSQKILVECALLGTDRSPNIPTLEGVGVADLMARVGQIEQSNAEKLLRAAAILGVCSRTGFEPSIIDHKTSGPERAELEAAAPADLLEPLLSLSSRRPLAQALQMMSRSRTRIPAMLLRQLLDLAGKNVDFRDVVIATLGERGRWLAAQDPSWAFAKSTSDGMDDEQKWKFGSLTQRTKLLQRLRLSDPQGARQRLMADLPQLPPAERATLIKALQVGLSLADEADLNKLLSDRAREPRRVAASLLVSMHSSAHAQSVHARVAALLQNKKGARSSWSIEPPQGFDEAWKAEGLVMEKPSQIRLGERGWWLQQLVGCTDVAWWCEHTGLTADELVQWAIKTEWSECILAGWIQSIEVLHAPQWAMALLKHAPRKDIAVFEYALLKQLEDEAHEVGWLKGLKKSNASSVANEIIRQLPLQKTLSEELSRALLKGLLEEIQQSARNTWWISRDFTEIACVLHPSSLPAVLALDAQAPTESHIQSAFTQAQIHAKARLAFHQWGASAPSHSSTNL